MKRPPEGSKLHQQPTQTAQHAQVRHLRSQPRRCGPSWSPPQAPARPPPNHPNLEVLLDPPALLIAAHPLPCPPRPQQSPPTAPWVLAYRPATFVVAIAAVPPHPPPTTPCALPAQTEETCPKPPPTPNTCITTCQAITRGSMSRISTLQTHLLPTIHRHYSHPHHTHHTTTPPPTGPSDRHCGGVAPCTTHPSHHLTSLGPSGTLVPSFRPLATAVALLSRGQGRGVACG